MTSSSVEFLLVMFTVCVCSDCYWQICAFRVRWRSWAD